jgi:hypothetical protein
MRHTHETSNNRESTQMDIENDNIYYLFVMYSNNNRLMESITQSQNEIRTQLFNMLNRNHQLQQQYYNQPPTLSTPTGVWNQPNFYQNTPNNQSSQTTNTRFNRFSNQRRDRPLMQDLNFIFDTDDILSLRNIGNLYQTTNSVPIVPTREQINISTRNILFSQLINPTIQTCPIILENFNDNSQITQILHCGHYFSQHALNRWFLSNATCPVCRFDIREHQQPNEEESMDDSDNTISREPSPSPLPTPIQRPIINTRRNTNNQTPTTPRQSTTQRQSTRPIQTQPTLSNIAESLLHNLLNENNRGQYQTVTDPSMNFISFSYNMPNI